MLSLTAQKKMLHPEAAVVIEEMGQAFCLIPDAGKAQNADPSQRTPEPGAPQANGAPARRATDSPAAAIADGRRAEARLFRCVAHRVHLGQELAKLLAQIVTGQTEGHRGLQESPPWIRNQSAGRGSGTRKTSSVSVISRAIASVN